LPILRAAGPKRCTEPYTLIVRLADYQPYWAARADLLARSGDIDAAARAYRQAIGLERDPAVRQFLQQRAAAVARGGTAKED
jgi:RNA polymerase sigma-70 factor (ECF subfamily)